ncbi:MAG: hypothetical protein LC114_15575 [Bryobacterales bacterium]|nr:hypothetical protein [Bryobacterales bacterium]
MDEMMKLPLAVEPYSQTALSLDSIRRAPSSKEQALEIGRHFEALLIREAVKAGRSAGGGGWLDDDASEASEATAQMGEEFLASALAAGGGFGLAALFSRSLEATLSAQEDSGVAAEPHSQPGKSISQPTGDTHLPENSLNAH